MDGSEEGKGEDFFFLEVRRTNWKKGKMVERPGRLRATWLLLKSSEAVPSQMIRHKEFLSSCLFFIQYSSLCLNSGIYPSVGPDLMQIVAYCLSRFEWGFPSR